MGKLISRSQIDPYFNNVELLLHLNGTNGSISFIDSSKNNFSITAYGDAQISTAQSKFGESSVVFDGSSAINIPASLIQFNTNQDFTVEAWVRLSSYGDRGIIGAYTSGTFNIAINEDGNVIVSRANIISFITSSTIIDLNEWYHIAVSREGANIRLFINGQLNGSYSDDTSFDLPTALKIGHLADEGSWWFDGYVDEFRITKSIARYTSNFTPLNKEFYDGTIEKNISIKKQNLGGGKLIAKQFSPEDIAGLNLWLKADAGVTYDGSNNVSSWVDQSTNSNNATSSGTDRPSYVSNVLNGKPVIRFNGAGQKMQLTNNIGGSAYSIFIVCKNNDNTNGSMFLWSTDNNYAKYIGIVTESSYNASARNKFILSENDEGSGNSGTLAWSSASVNNDFFIGTAMQNGGGRAYVNGDGSFDSIGGFVDENTFDLIGGYEFGYELDGDVAEIIAYNRVVTTEERIKIEKYLNTKYAIY